MALEMKKGMKFYQDPKFKGFTSAVAVIAILMFLSWYLEIKWSEFITF